MESRKMKGPPSQRAMEAARSLGKELARQSGVQTVGAGAQNGEEMLYVYVTRRRDARGIPETWEGIPVTVEVTGVIRPLRG